LANWRHPEAKFAKAVCCYRLYGDITLKLRRTRNSLARERGLGNEGAKNQSVIANLTLNGTRESLRDTRRVVGLDV
jgi:hypothetical protein